MLALSTSKSGHQIASINGISLHSHYNPHNEASRFVETALSHKTPGIVILLGASLGYLSHAIKSKFPHTLLICIYYTTSLFKKSFYKGDLNWHPEAGLAISTFLSRQLSELDIEGLEYLEWPACSLIWKDISTDIHASLQQVLRELSGSLITTIGAGKLWIKNTFFNFLCLENIVAGIPCDHNLPLVIIASGPSLKKSLPILRKHRKKYVLWSLPSALKFCGTYDLVPDVVIITDPGYYSTYHFHGNSSNDITMAMPLSASRGLWHQKGKIFLFTQPNYFEETVIAGLNMEFPRIPSNGTVAGSALELALKHTKNRIFLAGLDLCYSDIFSHVRPNTINDLFYCSSQRFSPYLSSLYTWCLKTATVKIEKQLCRTSQAYFTYSGWFSSLPKPTKNRIYRINPSPLSLPGIHNINEQELECFIRPLTGQKNRTSFHAVSQYPSYAEREKKAVSIIRGWLESLNQKQGCFSSPHKILHIFKDDLLLKLCYFISAQKLLELKRNIRFKNTTETKILAASLREEITSFLTQILQKIMKRQHL
ncbi:MAG: DUF115 domain-containing protein [Spirochaetales bacterium]|nr:DUF115 domain-containing protein [Spirochaetales bacterium]